MLDVMRRRLCSVHVVGFSFFKVVAAEKLLGPKGDECSPFFFFLLLFLFVVAVRGACWNQSPVVAVS